MGEAVWATWYDLAEDGRDDFLEWAHRAYLPFLKQRPGFSWVAHYKNIGVGPALKDYHDIAGHSPDSEGLAAGNQFVLLVGAATTHTFFKPYIFDMDMPPGFAQRLEQRLGVRTAILAEEARVSGSAATHYLPGSTPAPAIQFGTYRIQNEEDEFDLGCWYAQQRFPVMGQMTGAVMTRKFLSAAGWAKHAILYEFASAEARTRYFEEPHESKVVDPQEWTGRIVRTTLHTPGSPFVGVRIWPEPAPA